MTFYVTANKKAETERVNIKIASKLDSSSNNGNRNERDTSRLANVKNDSGGHSYGGAIAYLHTHTHTHLPKKW